MDIKNIYEKYILRFICAFGLCVSAALDINTQSGTGLNGFILFIAALFFTAFFTVFDVFRTSGKKSVFYAALAGFTGIVAVIIIWTNVPVVDSLNWLLFSRSPDVPEAFVYSLISLVAMVFVLSGLLFYVLRFYYIRLAAGFFLLVFSIIMAVFERNTGFVETLFIFIFIFAVLHENFLKNKIFLTYLLPFMLIAGIITAVLPSSSRPFQWTTAKSIFYGIGDFASRIGENFIAFFSGSDYEFEVNMTGYNESGNIGGGIRQSEKSALELTHYTNSSENIYLTGSVMDTYDGHGWTRVHNFNDSALPEYRLDSLELLLTLHNIGFFSMSEEEKDEIFAMREIGLEYLDIRTKSLFYPRIPLEFKMASSNSHHTDISGLSMFFDRITGKGTTYRVTYLDLNYAGDAFLSLFESNSPAGHNPVKREDLQKLFKENFPFVGHWEIPANYTILLESRKRKIYEQYTDLPETVPDRVYDLAYEITAGYNNDYMKMKAIEYYLLQNYAYSQKPALVSDIKKRDFTDVFLFETDEGYCTYFATAAAVLGRAAGIPTRYVQGFLASDKDENESGFSKTLTVQENNAHAWVEAYIDGVGWIPFEPSPAYTGARYASWYSRGVTRPSAVPVNPVYNTPNRPASPVENTEEELDEQNSRRRSFYLIAFITGAVIIIITVSAVFAGFYFSVRRSRKEYEKLSPSAKLLADYQAILMLFSLDGLKPLAGETAGQFSARLSDNEYAKITASFEKARYGNVVISNNESKATAAYKENLLNQNESGLKRRYGKMKYYLYMIKFRN
ncbi:MAG: hypothetical protein FWG44_02695 [Oscillospiraceae bacterium]|nr:hypothetical protein [Oscillospiraceae bacterium]